MADTKDKPKPPPPLPSSTRLLLSLSALCSTLHPASPPPPTTLKWYQATSSAWLKSVLKLLEIDAARLPPAVDVERVRSSAEEQRADWTDDEKVRMAGVLVEASLAVDAEKEKKEQALRYTPIARALSHRTLNLLGLPAKDLLPEAEKNLSSTLFTALKAAQENETAENVESTRAAHSQGWGGSFGRSLATGAGVVAGGILIGVTGGLAAPAIAAVLAPLGIGGLLAGGAAPIVLGTLFGVGGGGLAGRRVRERWKGVEEFGFIEVGDGTKATKEEIADLQEAKKKYRERKEQEKADNKKVEAEMADKAGVLDEKQAIGDEKTATGEKDGVDEKDLIVLDEKSTPNKTGETETEEPSEEEVAEAAKEVQEDRDLLEEKLLHLSLAAGTRTSISSESGSARPSLGSPRPSLDQGADDKSITTVKKPPSLTVSFTMRALLKSGDYRCSRSSDRIEDRSDHRMEIHLLEPSSRCKQSGPTC